MSKPAFPPFLAKSENTAYYEGMSLLEYYAGQALTGLCANDRYHDGEDWSRIPEYALYQAKNMMKELEKKD